MRFTWNPVVPAPYESAWMIFLKLLALNYCAPTDIVKEIIKPGYPFPKKLDFRNSSWIDINRFAVMLGVDPQRLHLCFLDQLGFPHVIPDEKGGIRFCPKCLAKGYHSVFFELGIIAGCPIHECLLTSACSSCATTVFRRGLIRVSRYPSPREMPDVNVPEYIYQSSCLHISFDPDILVWPTSMIKEEEMREIRCWGDRLVSWWNTVYSGLPYLSEVLAPLARFSFDEENKADLQNRAGMAVTIGGDCPWPLQVRTANRRLLRWKQSIGPDNATKEGTIPTSMFATYRVIRRHIYRRYVRPHKACWTIISNLSWLESKTLAAESVCVMALAYASWRMSIERFSNVECFKKNHPRSVARGVRQITRNDVNGRSNSHWWYAYFFSILEDIQALTEHGNYFIERTDDSAFDVDRSRAISWNLVRSHIVNLSDIQFESWSIVFPAPYPLVNKAETCCMGRPRGPDSMLDRRHRFDLDNWAWTGNSHLARPRCLFKIKNKSRLRYAGNSYCYLTV